MRVFKTKWFAREAKSHAIKDTELCQAIQDVMKGMADNLGGGVYKKRLKQNRDRCIILAKGGTRWVYAYLYAKQDKANIDTQELADFRRLADHYASLSDQNIVALLNIKELLEICHDCQK
ncbi:hypothetical protein J2125_001146 [Erwinia toletana]|uniref:Type II toxin-antitoxin system RelE/ParE family toxin n=1 Tax=Winslowiella toletana TaxID=92490 RepID=A0ABS4P5P0_9GAMM|nr:type II toxin-antitoxin system RelE/ParE family toxin [Winslowiella toletana]MBP2167954.1 hypothetical protein [Winslowiella toletana]